MSTTQKVITSAKEKVSSKASLLSPLENFFKEQKLQQKINSEVGKKGVTSESFTKRKDLEGEVVSQNPTWKEKVVKGAIKGSLGVLGLSAGREILSNSATENFAKNSASIITDDEKLKVMNDKIEEDLNNNGIISKMVKEKDPAKKAEMREKINKYRQQKFGFGDMLKDTWASTEFDENGEKNGFLKRVWLSFGRFFSNTAFYFGVKNAEKKGLFKQYEDLEKTSDDLKAQGKEAGKAVKNLKKAKRTTKTSGVIAARKLMKMKNGAMNAQDLVKIFEKKVAELTKQMNKNKISAPTMAKKLQDAEIKLFESVRLNGQQKQFLKLMKEGKIKGFPKLDFSRGKLGGIAKNSRKLGRVAGGIGVASAINIAMYEAIDQGKFSTFWKSLVSTKTLTEAFIPGVGSFNSIKRVLADPNQPWWFKAFDVGLNVAGDVMLVAGYVAAIGSFGGGAAVGVAGRAAVVGFGRRLLTKQGLKIAAKQTAKTAGTALKQGAKASLLSAPLMAGLQIAMKKLNPKRVEQAFVDNILSDEQRRTVNLTKRMRQEYKQAA